MSRRTPTLFALSVALGVAATISALPAQRFAGRGKDKPAEPGTEQPVDWPLEVNRACTAKRYGLRLAASRKVAGAGDQAVTALRAWAEQHGKNAIPAALVNAIADAETDGPMTFALLEGWSTDRDFFWRAQALRGLAERKRPEDRQRFLDGLQDPSHLVRMFAAKGLLQLGRASDADTVRARMLADTDPRVPPALAGMLLDCGRTTGLPLLLGALNLDHSFLGDPWGIRTASEAARALERFLEVDLDFVAGSPDGDPASAKAVTKKVVALLAGRGIDPGKPVATSDLGRSAVGGVEIRSCRNGDLFLRWSKDGELFSGLDGSIAADLSELAGVEWPEVRQFLDREQGMATYGVVICDFARLADSKASIQIKAAPNTLPLDLVGGLKGIASVLEENGSKELAEALRERLSQFAPADSK